MKTLWPGWLAFALLAVYPAAQAQTSISVSGYAQNFNGIGSGLPTDWTLRTGATASALGTSGAAFGTSPTTWATTTGQFANYASAATGAGASNATQNAATDRALGIRQGASFGDPGAAFVFNFNSTGHTITALSIDLMMLSVQTRSTTWSIQYGTGASPASFTSLTTAYSDPGVFGATSITLSSGLGGISNQSNVWFRVAALSASGGTGTRDTFAIDNFALSASAIAVPEPSTYAALLGAVGLAIALIRRRRSRRAARQS